MNTLREAAQQALEALENTSPLGSSMESDKKFFAAITALRAALAEHDKKIVWVEERKAHWAEQLQLARETQERERQQREEAALAEPVQEPVYWEVRCTAHPKWMRVDEQQFDEYVANGWEGQRLYAAPPQRKPLTEEEIDSIWDSEKAFADIYAIVRAIERAHGIT